MSAGDPKRGRLAVGLYRALLTLYPAGYRREYADEQARVFADLCRDARPVDLPGVWLRSANDLAAGVSRERVAALAARSKEFNVNRETWLILGLALLMAVLLGFIDQKTVEVQGTLLFLLPFGFILGLLQPSHAWRQALILGVSIPVAGLIGRALGVEPVGLAHARQVTGQPLPFTYTQALTSFIAMIPAFIAVYAGVGAYRLLFTLRRATS